MKSAISLVAAHFLFVAAILRAEAPAQPPAAADTNPAKSPEGGASGKPDAKARIGALRSSYEVARAVVAADREKWLAALRTWYGQELTKLQAERAKLGDLEGAVAGKAERERITASAEPTQAQIDAMPEALRKLRAIYDAGLKRIADEAARRNDAADRKLLADLGALQKQLTVGGDLDNALAVRVERERIEADIARRGGGGSDSRPEDVTVRIRSIDPEKPGEPAKSTAPGDAADGRSALQAAIEDTEWTWERGTLNEWIRFGKDGAMKHLAFEGTWEAIDGHDVHIKAAWGEGMLRFNDTYTEYRATTGKPNKQGVKGSKK
jgi:hypothetical protein